MKTLKRFYSQGCTRRGTILNEMMHTLGFWHEHTRADRDEHITVNWTNVKETKRYHFNIKEEETFSEPYDIHYPSKAFSKNGKPTITHKVGVKRYIRIYT